ncbi:MAG: hypothetical protein M1831_001571 [Alyxoria varia]|nr:MAG: hypothetical protein M1831_001571 [Alyxoria varia]
MQYALTFVALVAATYTNALVATPAHLSHADLDLPAPTATSTLTKRDDGSADRASLKQLVDAAVEKYNIDEYLTPEEMELAQSYIFGNGAAKPTISGTPTVSVSTSAAASQSTSLDDIVDAAINSFSEKEKTLLAREAAPEPTPAPEPEPPHVNGFDAVGKIPDWFKRVGGDIKKFFARKKITSAKGYSLFLPAPPGKRDIVVPGPMTEGTPVVDAVAEPTGEPVVEPFAEEEVPEAGEASDVEENGDFEDEDED